MSWLLLAMIMTEAGMVMNANTDALPRGCAAITRDYQFRIEGGREFASQPGMVYGWNRHELRVEPCSRVTVTFANRDEVRHQWMVHGLPRYLYAGGMFHIEVNGGESITGTFIVPPEHRTYLLHCDMAHHTEMGMKGQLVVGRGSGNLWSVAGVSDAFERDDYLPQSIWVWLSFAAALGLLLATWRRGARPLFRYLRERRARFLNRPPPSSPPMRFTEE